METGNNQIPVPTEEMVAQEEFLTERPSFLAKPIEEFQRVELFGMPFFLYDQGSQYYFVTLDGQQIYESEEEILRSLSLKNEVSSKKTLEELLQESDRETKDVIHEITKLLKEYCYLKDEKEYKLIAFYIMLTYSYRYFNRIPYISLRGEKGSGKTTLMLLMQELSYKPQLFSSITPSALFHVIDSTGPTLLLDEAENLISRSSSNSPVFQILNSGYQADGKVSRVEAGLAVEYSTYCPKVIAGINPLLAATEDRCIIVMMEKASAKEKLKPLVDVHRLSIRAAEIRHQIHTILNKFSSSVIGYYRDPSSLLLSSDVRNRDLDKWLPLLSLSKALSTPESDYFKGMTELALENIRRQKASEANLPENSCKRLIIEFVKANKADSKKVLRKDNHFYYVSAEEFFDEVTQKDFSNSYNAQAEVTRALKKASIPSSRQRFKSEPVIVYKVPLSFISKK
jgi:hypothetical protein